MLKGRTQLIYLKHRPIYFQEGRTTNITYYSDAKRLRYSKKSRHGKTTSIKGSGVQDWQDGRRMGERELTGRGGACDGRSLPTRGDHFHVGVDGRADGRGWVSGARGGR